MTKIAKIAGAFASALLASVGALPANGVSHSEVVIFHLVDSNRHEDVPLLQVLEDLPAFFGDQMSDQLAFPPSFAFPRSFEYKATFGHSTMVRQANSRTMRQKIYEGRQSATFDAENNRVRIERENRVY